MAYCTICCAEKDTSEGTLPAIERYLSDRIRKVAAQSIVDGVAFYIFSGKFGLITPDTEIEWYDYKLPAEEVQSMSEKLTTQLVAEDITSLRWFAPDPKDQSGWEPYESAMSQACLNADVEMTLARVEDN